MPKAVIMAGGQGERFWPLTHKKFPKYRIRLDGKNSLLQKTYSRLLKVYSKNDVYVVTTKEHLKLIRQELPSLKLAHILIEPFRNNTASAIFFTCRYMAKSFGPNEVVTFYPADHLIQNEDLFKSTIQQAIRLAKSKDYLVTIGIMPTFPAIGFGYIQAGSPIPSSGGAYFVKRFAEKPNLKKAKNYLRDKNYFWNGGIFSWRAGVFLKTMKTYAPDFGKNFDLVRLKESYAKLPSISIDYVLLEKAKNIALIKAKMDWCDMGSWDMFHEKAGKNNKNLFTLGHSKHAESENTLILNYTPNPVVALGLKNIIVVQTLQGTLVCSRTRSEEAALLFKKS